MFHRNQPETQTAQVGFGEGDAEIRMVPINSSSGSGNGQQEEPGLEEINAFIKSSESEVTKKTDDNSMHFLTKNILIGIRFILALFILSRDLSVSNMQNLYSVSSAHHSILGLPTVIAVVVWKAIELKVKPKEFFLLVSWVSFLGSLVFMLSGILFVTSRFKRFDFETPKRSPAFLSFLAGMGLIIIANVAESLLHLCRRCEKKGCSAREIIAPLVQAGAFALMATDIYIYFTKWKALIFLRPLSALLIVMEALVLSEGLQSNRQLTQVYFFWNAFFKFMASLSSLMLVVTFDVDYYEKTAVTLPLEYGLQLPFVLFLVCIYFDAEKAISKTRDSHGIAFALIVKAIIPTGFAVWCLITLYMGLYQIQIYPTGLPFICSSAVLAVFSFVHLIAICWKLARLKRNRKEGSSPVGRCEVYNEGTLSAEQNEESIHLTKQGNTQTVEGHFGDQSAFLQSATIKVSNAQREDSGANKEHVLSPSVSWLNNTGDTETRASQAKKHRRSRYDSFHQSLSTEEPSLSAVYILGKFFRLVSYVLFLASFIAINMYRRNGVEIDKEERKTVFVATAMILNIGVGVFYLVHSLCWIHVHKRPRGHGDGTAPQYTFPEDTYTLMMFSEPFTQVWLLGLAVFALQATLTVMILISQIARMEDNKHFLDVPYAVSLSTRIGQVAGMIIILFYQEDYWVSSTLLTIRFTKRSNFPEEVSVLFPNIIRFIQSLGVILASTILILQSDNIIDLVKDYTAILFISEIDNFVFNLAQQGYLRSDFKKSTEEAKEKEIYDVSEHTLRFIGFITILGMMLALWVYVMNNQLDDTFFKTDYPFCFEKVGKKRMDPLHFGDGVCDTMFNFEECDFDGGDCVVRNLIREAHVTMEYPDCQVTFKSYIGKFVLNLCLLSLPFWRQYRFLSLITLCNQW